MLAVVMESAAAKFVHARLSKEDGAFVGALDTRNHARYRALTATALPDEARDAACLERERYVIYGREWGALEALLAHVSLADVFDAQHFGPLRSESLVRGLFREGCLHKGGAVVHTSIARAQAGLPLHLGHVAGGFAIPHRHERRLLLPADLYGL